MDIASACIFGYTFPAALFFTVHAYMSIKEYIVEYLYNDSWKIENILLILYK
jgi:hypothetical protein